MLRNNADVRRCLYFELGLPVILRGRFDWAYVHYFFLLFHTFVSENTHSQFRIA